MIEDALKSTRNLHRLIIGVSLAVLVFSLSMYLAEDKVRQKAAIDALIDIDFLSYEDWLQKKLDIHIAANVVPAVKPVRDLLEDSGYLIFDLDSIADVLEETPHIGRFLVDESILANVSATTLTSLDALNGLSLEHDGQLAVPKVDSLIGQLEEFLAENNGAGKRITNAATSVTGDIPILTTFLPDTTSIASLDFQLADVSVAAAVPVFQGLYDVDLMTIPDSSYLAWLEQQGHASIAVQGGELRFLPDIATLPKGFSEEPLGKLSLRLADEIRAAGPEQRTLTILGTEVPGRLLVLAAPLILLALLYYFKSHLSHLTRMSEHHAGDMVGFSWLPINASSWEIPGTHWRWSGYLAEIVATLAVLPVGALLVMYFRLRQFGEVGIGTSLVIGCACCVALLICWMSLNEVNTIRERLQIALGEQADGRGVE